MLETQTSQHMPSRTLIQKPFFTETDVAKKRSKRTSLDLDNQYIANCLNGWVQERVWELPHIKAPEQLIHDLGTTRLKFNNNVYRYGYEKKMLPKDMWSPYWGRRSQPKPEPDEAPHTAMFTVLTRLANLEEDIAFVNKKVGKLEEEDRQAVVLIIEKVSSVEARLERVEHRFESLSEELVIQTGRIDSAHNRVDDALSMLLNPTIKKVHRKSRFERFRKGFVRRLAYLAKGK